MEHEIGGDYPLPLAVDFRSADRLVQVIDRRSNVGLLVPVGECEPAGAGIPPFTEHSGRTISERDNPAAGLLPGVAAIQTDVPSVQRSGSQSKEEVP